MSSGKLNSRLYKDRGVKPSISIIKSIIPGNVTIKDSGVCLSTPLLKSTINGLFYALLRIETNAKALAMEGRKLFWRARNE